MLYGELRGGIDQAATMRFGPCNYAGDWTGKARQHLAALAKDIANQRVFSALRNHLAVIDNGDAVA